jgi:hypothetical protein
VVFPSFGCPSWVFLGYANPHFSPNSSNETASP